MLACPLPVRASLRDLLTDLLGHPVSVTAGDPAAIGPDSPAVVVAYRRDDDAVAAAMVYELSLAAAAGAAIGMVPPSVAEGQSGAGALAGDLADFFREVANVVGKLLNTPQTPHVVLGEVTAVPGRVKGDLARVVLEPARRLDYRVCIDSYGSGTLTVLGA